MVTATTQPLEIFYDQIRRCTQPEALFGDLGSTQHEQFNQLEAAFRALIKQYHPDRYAGDPADLRLSTEITKRINDLRQQALVKIRANLYGGANQAKITSVIQSNQHEYFVTELLVEGAEANIYHGFYLDPSHKNAPKQEVVIKIIADRKMNRLAAQEAAFYQKLSHFCFPSFIESFRAADGKQANVLSYAAGSYDLIELGQRYRQQYHAPGLPQEHLVWILDRFLCALGMLHQNGILHGNIQPDNLMVQPESHNGLLIDFLHCRFGQYDEEVFDIVNPAYCAPELMMKHFKPHPVSDIYALGRCMIEMLGGRGRSLDDDIVLHPRLRALLQQMIQSDPGKRAADAWALAAQLKQIRQHIFGSSYPFHPLKIGG